MKHLSIALLALAALVTPTTADHLGLLPDASRLYTRANWTIAQNLNYITQTSTLYQVFTSNAFASTLNLTFLSQPGQYTVFAPSNAAFAAFRAINANPPVGYIAPAQPTNFTNALPPQAIPYLSEALKYHITPALAPYSTLQPTNFFPTLLTTPSYVNAYPNNAQHLKVVKNPDGSVILPFDASYNSNHFAQVKIADIQCSNGIIHVIDQILPIPNTAVQTAARTNLGNFVTTVNAADLAGTVNTAANITIFAPVNSAFTATLNQLRTSGLNATQRAQTLMPVLASHVLQGVVHSTQLMPMTVTTLAGTTLQIAASGNSSFTVGGASIVEADIPIVNGVLHIINQTVMTA